MVSGAERVGKTRGFLFRSPGGSWKYDGLRVWSWVGSEAVLAQLVGWALGAVFSGQVFKAGRVLRMEDPGVCSLVG